MNTFPLLILGGLTVQDECIDGSRGRCRRPTNGIQFFVFAYTLLKSTCVGGQRPHQRIGTPQQEILDPPLECVLTYFAYGLIPILVAAPCAAVGSKYKEGSQYRYLCRVSLTLKCLTPTCM